MSGKKVLPIIVAAVCTVAVVAVMLLRGGQSSSADTNQNAAKGLAAAAFNGSFAGFENQLNSGLAKNANQWLPQISANLKEKYGIVKSVELESKDQPASGWTGENWKVHAERGDYEMRIERKSDGLIGHLQFRATPSDPWYP